MSELKLYRPSNGCEGEWFLKTFCSNCIHDDVDLDLHDGCKIIADTMAYCVDDPNYPREWIVNENGQPECTKFCDVSVNHKRTHKCTKTKDMFNL